MEFSRLLRERIGEVAEYGKLFSPLNQENRRGIWLSIVAITSWHEYEGNN